MNKGDNRALRGGSFNNNAENTRVSIRNNNNPDNTNNNIGFRCAQDSSKPELEGCSNKAPSGRA